MRSNGIFAGLALACGVLVSAPAGAEVVDATDAGFTIKFVGETSAGKDDAWRMLIAPAKWWSSEHTYSGDAANLYIDAQATGCFCEKLPKPADAPEGQRMGSVEHMHVIYADPQRGVLRLSGGLGPLQGEAASGTLTITLKPSERGTTITWVYTVGGYMQAKPQDIAPMVDKVLGEQADSLATKLGKPATPEGAFEDGAAQEDEKGKAE